MRRCALTFVAALAITITLEAGCNDKPAKPTSEAPGSGSDALKQLGEQVQAPVLVEGTKLTAPGKPPLALLRYHLTKGDKTASELVWDYQISDTGKSTPIPTVVLDLETTVVDVAADGSAVLETRLTKATVRAGLSGTSTGSGSGKADPPVSSDAMLADVAAMRGMVFRETLAPDGRLSNFQGQPSGHDTESRVATARIQALATLGKSLEQASTRLPAEPIGVDASWHEHRLLPKQDMVAMADTTYALTAMTGSKLDYKAVTQVTGDPQRLAVDGMDVQVLEIKGHAETQGTLDLAHYAPQLTSSSTFSTTIDVEPQANTPDAGALPGIGKSTLDITMAIQIAPIPVGSAPAEPTGAP